MKLRFPIPSPIQIVAFTAISLLAYLAWRGPERFYYESFGTWLLSPIIYPRILPTPLGHWLLRALVHHPSLSYFFYAVPVLMLGTAVVTAIISIRRHSRLSALASFTLIAMVFGTYHYLQPLGITLNTY